MTEHHYVVPFREGYEAEAVAELTRALPADAVLFDPGYNLQAVDVRALPNGCYVVRSYNPWFDEFTFWVSAWVRV